MRAHLLEVLDALLHVPHCVLLDVFPQVLVSAVHVVVCRRGARRADPLAQQLRVVKTKYRVTTGSD